MSNPNNNPTLVGRLARDPQFFENSDGSQKVLITVGIARNYPDAKGEYGIDWIPVEAFIRKDVKGKGPFEYLFKDSMVSLGTALRMDNYTDKSGKQVYQLKVVVENVIFLDSRETADALAAKSRAAKVAVAEAAQAAAAPAPAVAEEPAYAQDLPFGR